ncbi:restriction endonuclease subunit S [uncultured Veillonella sp.]|uniref:restriction endonuclease subunit S n=1 Tax=uncultured Veillonella sp. TaxID=159268 RepID=UPI0028D2C33B|nr:restriction endonuclease subunit S [uncultured Veillonella sp.]
MRNKPRIRFKGFTEDWEQRKLGDIATITGGGTPSTNISEYWNGDIDWYSPVEIGEKRYASGSIRKITKLGLEKSSAKILPVGTVLFTSRAGIGNTAILQVEGCTNQGFQSITPNSKELDTYFLYTMTPKLKRYGEVTGAGSTFVEVSGKQMEQMNLMIPSLDEQKHVSQLFKVMDDAITLHQRKLEKLKLAKKALLQKLFPKNGSQFPEIRFKGFTDAWEQRKLGTILSRRKENRLIDSAYPRLAFAAGQGVIPLSERRTNNRDQLISDEKNKKYLVTYYNDIVYNPANVKYGAIDRNKYGQGVISPIYVTFTSNVCSGFIEHIVKSNDFKQKALSFEEGTVTKRQAVNPDNLLNIDVNITLNIKEQKKLSNLFEMLDQYITLHQRKLERLQEVKKGLLQKMFV